MQKHERSKTLETPLRKEVYDLISKKIAEHIDVTDCTFTVKYYLPSKYRCEVKTIERRKTKDGEEKVTTETHVECDKLDWLIDELKNKGYKAELKEESAYVYGKYGYLLVST